jgi:peroxiredoxin
MKRIPLALLIATLAALTAIVGLLFLMGQLSSPAPTPTLPTAVEVLAPETPTGSPHVPPANPLPTETVVATVDGVPIAQSAWQEAAQLDAVMSRLANQPIPSAEETLDRLVNDILLLRASNLATATVASAEVEARIAGLEAGWGRTDGEIVSALEAAGLTRQSLANRVAHLILVEQAVNVLSSQYLDLDAWLAQTRQAAEISLYQPLDTAETAAQSTAISTTGVVPSSPVATPTPPVPATGLPVAAQPQAVAPDFTLTGLDGQSVRLNDLRGRPLLLNFWASWCPPCRAELPALQAAYQRYGDRVAFLGVDVKESSATVAAFAPQFGLTFPLLLDSDGAVSDRLYQVRGIPTSLFIAPEGVVSARHVGPLAEADIDRYLAPLLEAEATVTPTSEPAVKLAPDFTLDSAQGTRVTLSDYRGKSNVVLVFYRGQT